jgi:hypothetical protein
MAGYSIGYLSLGILFWAMAIALGLLVAGTFLLWFHHRLERVGGSEVEQLSDQLARLESQIERYLHVTGGYQEWARIRDHDRDQAE